MTQLFNRICKVTAWRQRTQIGSLDVAYFEKLGNGIEITDLRMAFNIDKHLGSEPNKCTITVYNLNPGDRSDICRKPIHIRIDAGYADTGYRSLFFGDLTFGESKRTGIDIETKLQVGDGARAIGFARTNRSFTKPVSAYEVLKYAAGTMNLTLPPEIEQAPELRGALANGLSVKGPTRDVLTRLLAPYAYHWSVQNGKLVILRDEQIIQNQAALVNTSSGLIGSPERSAPDKATGRSEVTCDVALWPELTPGQSVRLESKDISGTFKLIQITHVGDTRGDDFKSQLKLVPR